MKTIIAALLFFAAIASPASASSLTVATGQQVTISVAVTPPNVTLPLTYQWSKAGSYSRGLRVLHWSCLP